MAPEIMDIRPLHVDGSVYDASPRDELRTALRRPFGEKSMPTVLLYDERGLRLYDTITTDAPEYYLFPMEEDILIKHADEIVRVMHTRERGEITPGEVVLELGAGALRKTSRLLHALSKLVVTPKIRNPITYYALDLEMSELRRTLEQLVVSPVGKDLEGKVEVKGLCTNYAAGLKFVEEGGLQMQPILDAWPSKHQTFAERGDTSSSSVSSEDRNSEVFTSPPSTPDAVQPPLHIMFLGSSLGNFSREEASNFLRSLPLRSGSGDTLLLGLDHDNDPHKVQIAYNDPAGHTRNFVMNGLRSAGRVLGNENLIDEHKWEYVGFYNVAKRRHEAFYKSKVLQTLQDPATQEVYTFAANELVNIEYSHKFSQADAYRLFSEANLRPIQRWTDSASQYSLWLLERPPFVFPALPGASDEVEELDASKASNRSDPFGVPTLNDWSLVWATWDFITLEMIPPSMLFQRPIDLRHICLFYLGHIPTFLDIHLSRLLQEPHSEPKDFKYIFERGIDPDVDDPTQCHPHSEVPQLHEGWPSLASILSFRSRVRERLTRLYSQISDGQVILDRRVARVLFMTFEHEAWHAETLLYMLIQRAGSGTIPPPRFCPPPWDSLVSSWQSAPKPLSATVALGPAIVSIGHDDFESDDLDPEEMFKVAGHEFGWDNEHPRRDVYVDEFRIEWRPVTNGQFYNFYIGQGNGQVSFPASWVEVDGEVLVRTLYGPVPMKVARDWPVMTSGADLSAYARVKGGRLPTDAELRVFYDKFNAGYEGGANVGFRNWHPVPATTGVEKDMGRGHNGGVWEWTSTVFDKFDGFVPSSLYPGYSMDFFDGRHQLVLGGSYATIPRIADRRTVRNWFQKNYPYPWVGARVVYPRQT